MKNNVIKQMASYQLVGLGTYKLKDLQCVQIVSEGLKLGYRLIDTAQLYKNHNQIAQAIELSGISREEIFIQSKIHNSNIKKLKIAESIGEIKKELETDYIDLILLHNPVTNYNKAWEELVRCQNHLNIKYIGVSNFNIDHLNKIIGQTGCIPWLNQIELNLFNQQDELVKYNRENNIITQSHTTLTKKAKLDDPELINWAKQIELSTPKLMYKFVLDQQIGILPRTSNQTHLYENYNLVNSPVLFDSGFINSNQDLIKKFDIKFKIY